MLGLPLHEPYLFLCPCFSLSFAAATWCQALAGDPSLVVTSPTFLLMNEYEFPVPATREGEEGGEDEEEEKGEEEEEDM